jgi:hypothetical protein
MKNVIKLLTAGVALLAASALFGQSVTITANVRVQDDVGVYTDGMLWGFVMDVNGDGFDGLETGQIGDQTLVSPGTEQFLLDATGTPTDDIIYLNDNLTVFAPPLGGSGCITTMTGLPINAGSSLGIATGQQWAAVWFPTLGAGAGALNLGEFVGFNTNAANILPAEGSTETQDFMADGVAATVAVVPEPSTYAAIFGLMVLGLAYLRRRK